MAAPPPQDITCPDPDGCPVATTLPRLTTVPLTAGTPLYRVYNATWGYGEHNPGYGDARFSPIDDPATGKRLPGMYLAASRTAALLETVFRDVHHASGRIIYERDLVGKLLAHMLVPAVAALGDLRDPQLARMGVQRSQVVSSPAEHYPCVRRLAIQALAAPDAAPTMQGLIWHSRQAELASGAPVEVIVLFGEPRYPSGRGSWPLLRPGTSTLYEGPGRLLVDEIAQALEAVIELDGS
jgi:hypothetical protein